MVSLRLCSLHRLFSILPLYQPEGPASTLIGSCASLFKDRRSLSRLSSKLLLVQIQRLSFMASKILGRLSLLVFLRLGLLTLMASVKSTLVSILRPRWRKPGRLLTGQLYPVVALMESRLLTHSLSRRQFKSIMVTTSFTRSHRKLDYLTISL